MFWFSINKYKKSRIRLIYKGDKILRAEGKQRFVHELKQGLTTKKLRDPKLIGMPAYENFDSELVLRQFLTSKILGISFNKSFNYSIAANKPLIHPLPIEWSKYIESQGVNINIFGCFLFWRSYCLYFFTREVFLSLKKINLVSNYENFQGKFSYFVDLKNNFDSKCISSNPRKHNIINWYLKWQNRNKSINLISHDDININDFHLNNIKISNLELFPKLRRIKLIKFTFFCIYLYALALFLFIINPYHLLLAKEILRSKRFFFSDKSDLAEDYLFNNSYYLYRPIWTYEAELKGSRVLLYFYSANMELTEASRMETLQHPWHLMNWPNYLVWDKYQTNFIKSHNKRSYEIEEVGPIWFSTCEDDIEIAPNSIAVFDISPFRISWHSFLGISFEYYTYELVNKFLTDVQLVLNENNIKMLHKMKRESNLVNKKYLRRIKFFENCSNYETINPSIDALQVVQNTLATISIPFTSTSIFAKYENKPSAYYDPTGLMRKDLNASHGIPILSNINELREWVKNLIQ